MKPLFTLSTGHIVAFEAQEEDRTARQHFIKECGWTESQFRKIKDFPFFCAHVAIFKDGKQIQDTYLGACSYKTEEEFYTRYVGDYFADMVRECALQSHDLSLIEAANTWANEVRNPQEVDHE